MCGPSRALFALVRDGLRVFRPSGAGPGYGWRTHSLRCGLYSFAALRLLLGLACASHYFSHNIEIDINTNFKCSGRGRPLHISHLSTQ